METEIIKRAKSSTKHWYLSLIVGILFIGVGIWVFITPVSSYLALSILFSLTIFVSGIFEIIYSISNRKEIDNWGWVLTGGIIDLLFGIWLMASPLLSIAILPFVVGFMLMVRAIMAIGFSFDLKDVAKSGWGWLLALSIIGLLFSFVLLWNPAFAGLTLVIWTGCAFVTLGFYRIILSFKLMHLYKLSKKISRL